MTPRGWRILMWCAAAGFAAYRIPELWRYSLWYDEVFSLTLVQMDWSEMFAAALRDRTNPPLFYALLKAWTSIGGESFFWIRVLPCLIAIATAVPFVALAKRCFGSGKSGIAAGAAAVAAAAASPLLVFLSNEVRGYSLLVLLSTVSMLAFYRVTETLELEQAIREEAGSPSPLGHFGEERKRRIVMLALVNTLLVYTHYFGWLLIAAELVVALGWYRPALRWMFAANAAAAVVFAPWAIAVAMSAGGAERPLANVDWISAPSVRDIPVFYDALVARVLTLSTANVGLVIMLAIVAVMVIAVASPRRAEGSSRARELAVLAVLPVLLAYVASVALGRSVFVPRYLVVVAPAWLLLIGATVAARGGLTARGAHDMERELRVRATVFTFVIFTLACGALREVRGGEKIQWQWIMKSIAQDAILADSAGQLRGTIYTLEGFTALPAAYYAHAFGGALTVRPLGTDPSFLAPAWLVERSLPSGEFRSHDTPLLGQRLRLTELVTERVPSHAIRAYRIDPR